VIVIAIVIVIVVRAIAVMDVAMDVVDAMDVVIVIVVDVIVEGVIVNVTHHCRCLSPSYSSHHIRRLFNSMRLFAFISFIHSYIDNMSINACDWFYCLVRWYCLVTAIL